MDAYGQHDILGAYGDSDEALARTRSNSPVKTRTAQPSSSSNGRPSPSSRSKSYGEDKPRPKKSSGSSSGASKPKSDLDVIDRLDISGLYGGGGEYQLAFDLLNWADARLCTLRLHSS